MPGRPEVVALLALMLLHDSRRAARTGVDGELVLLADQDRSLWDAERIGEGLKLAEAARAWGPRPYVLEALIAAEHARAPTAADTDWERIVRLYAWLAELNPSPVVELNRAVAVAMARGPAEGLALIDAIDGLGAYGPYHVARADLLRRLEHPEAVAAYERAVELAANPVERAFLERRLAEARGSTPRA